MKFTNLVLLAGVSATLAQDYASENSYSGDDAYKGPSPGTSYNGGGSSYGAPSAYDNGPSYGGSSYSGSSYDDYPQQKSSYSYDSKMPSYGKATSPFVDAWFTFNKKDGKIKEVANSGARVTINEGENTQIILEGIFEDDNDFEKANQFGRNKINVNCANKILGHEEKDAGCVTDYTIGVEFATGASTKKYMGSNYKDRHDPAVVALNSYGHAPVTTPSVKLLCHEIRSAEPTEGAFGEWNDVKTTVATKKIRAASFTEFTRNNEDVGEQFDPPIFSVSNHDKACWHARGAPHHKRVGTCLKDDSSSTTVVNNSKPLFSTYPCFPVATSNQNVNAPNGVGTMQGPNAGGRFNCPSVEPEFSGGAGFNQYCSTVQNLGGCFPGCKAGEPADANEAINQRDSRMTTGNFVEGKLFLAGHCGWPQEAACENKPRAIKCTAVIELGFAAVRYDDRHRGYDRSGYKLSK